MLKYLNLSTYVNLLLASRIICQSWSYDNQLYWSLQYPACAGHQQSPINIQTRYVYKNGSLELEFRGYYQESAEYMLVNNGHSIMFTYNGSPYKAPSISGNALNGHKYSLAQLHFHWGYRDGIGSEHRIDGYQFEMELHLVHYDTYEHNSFQSAIDANKGLMVMAVLYQVDNTDATNLNSLISNVNSLKHRYTNQTIPAKYSIRLSDLLPGLTERLDFFTYKGSLTMPPCTEGVTWLVLNYPKFIGKKQIKAFRESKNFKHKNSFRQIQPLYRRKVQVSY